MVDTYKNKYEYDREWEILTLFLFHARMKVEDVEANNISSELRSFSSRSSAHLHVVSFCRTSSCRRVTLWKDP